jgi:glutamyl/glutaminyl-tRNA synthetase
VTSRLKAHHEIERPTSVDYRRLIGLLKERARTLDDLVDQAVPYLVDEFEFDSVAVRKHWQDPSATRELLSTLKARLSAAEWTAEALEPVIRGIAAEREVGAGRVIHPLRLALVGRSVSPSIFDVLEVMGKDEVLARIDRAIEALSEPSVYAALTGGPESGKTA